MTPCRSMVTTASSDILRIAASRERASASVTDSRVPGTAGARPCWFWWITGRPCLGPESRERVALGQIDAEEPIEVEELDDRIDRGGEGDEPHASALLLELLHEHQEGADAARPHERDLGEIQHQILAVSSDLGDPLKQDWSRLDVQATPDPQEHDSTTILRTRNFQFICHGD